MVNVDPVGKRPRKGRPAPATPRDLGEPDPGGARRGRTRPKLTRDKALLLALGLPGGVALLLFHYVPLLGNVIAFQDYQPYLAITEAPFVGFTNFSFLWDGNPEFLNALGNTI